MNGKDVEKMREALNKIGAFAAETKPEDWIQTESKDEWYHRGNKDVTIVAEERPMFERPIVKFRGRSIHINNFSREHKFLLEDLWKHLERMADDERDRVNCKKTIELYHAALKFVKTFETKEKEND